MRTAHLTRGQREAKAPPGSGCAEQHSRSDRSAILDPAPTRGAAAVLLGRDGERRAIEGLLSSTRSAHGRAVVIHGEPGIGKSALLAWATAAATGFQILTAVGNQAEQELAYAAAQQLCAPSSAALELLP